MKINIRLLSLGLFFMTAHFLYKNFDLPTNNLTSLLFLVILVLGVSLISVSIFKKGRYKINEVRQNKIFEIKSIYITPWETRVGISFKDTGGQYFISPIPEELMGAVCGEKYYRQKNKIVKIQ